MPGTARRAQIGRFGPGGAPRFFVSFGVAEVPSLLGWHGAGVVLEPQPQLADLVMALGDQRPKTSNGLVRGYDDMVRFSTDESQRFVASADGLAPSVIAMYAEGETTTSGPWSVADLDGDGVDELIVSSWPNLEGRPRLRVLTWTGEGFTFFGPPIDYNLEVCGVGLAMAVLDADADGFEDLAISTDCKRKGAEGQLYLVRGAADLGQIQKQISGTTSLTADGYWFSAYLMEAHDLDGDDVPDLALMNYDGYLSVMRGAGDGTWTEANLARDGDDRNGPPDGVDGDIEWEWTFADIDGNGVTDILAGRSVLLDPFGLPAFVDYLPRGAIPMISIFSSAGDISGDGVDDLLVRTVDDTIEVLISNRL